MCCIFHFVDAVSASECVRVSVFVNDCMNTKCNLLLPLKTFVVAYAYLRLCFSL